MGLVDDSESIVVLRFFLPMRILTFAPLPWGASPRGWVGVASVRPLSWPGWGRPGCLRPPAPLLGLSLLGLLRWGGSLPPWGRPLWCPPGPWGLGPMPV